MMRAERAFGVSPPPCGVTDDSANQTHSVRLNSRSPSGYSSLKSKSSSSPQMKPRKLVKTAEKEKCFCILHVVAVGVGREPFQKPHERCDDKYGGKNGHPHSWISIHQWRGDRLPGLRTEGADRIRVTYRYLTRRNSHKRDPTPPPMNSPSLA